MLIIPPEFLPIKGYPATYFYRLEDPFTNEVVYIGQTDNLKQRHYNHFGRPGMYSGNALKDMWAWQLLRELNTEPVMRVIECMEDGWSKQIISKRKRTIIAEYWAKGCPLFNDWGRRGNAAKRAERITTARFWQERKPFWG